MATVAAYQEVCTLEYIRGRRKGSRRKERDIPSLQRLLISAVQKTTKKGEEVANK